MLKFKSDFKTTLYLFLTLIVGIFCSVFSVLLTVDVWNKFTSGFTATGARFQDSNVDRKLLPCLTVCPWAAFKKQGLHYNLSDYLNYTTDQNELIVNMSFASVNAADYTVETIRSVNFGRCYMICYAKEVKENEKFILALTKKSDITGKSHKFKLYISKISNKFILSLTVVYSQFTLHTKYKLLKKVQR